MSLLDEAEDLQRSSKKTGVPCGMCVFLQRLDEEDKQAAAELREIVNNRLHIRGSVVRDLILRRFDVKISESTFSRHRRREGNHPYA